MKLKTAIVGLVFLAFTVAPSLRAQSTALQPASTVPSWSQLQGYEFEDQSTLVASAGTAATDASGPGSSSTLPTQLSAAYLSHAQDLSSFIAANAGDGRLAEARRLEVLMLLYAEFYGDTSKKSDRDALVATVRKDTALPTSKRFPIAVLADTMAARLGTAGSGQAAVTAVETALRALASEFSTEPGAYEALLSFAEGGVPDAEAATILSDLVKMPAPATVLTSAKLWLARLSLVGQSLPALISSTPGLTSPPSIAPGNLAVLYAWSTKNPTTRYTASQIAASVSAGTTVIGVCLETDVASAKVFASSANLPGAQLYDSAGLNSAVAKQFDLSDDDVVIIANANGVIITVTGAYNLAAKLAVSN